MCWKKNDAFCAFFRSFGYAAKGVWRMIQKERNFRFHLVAAAYILGFAPRFLQSRGEWAVLILTVCAVLGLELVNTAVEHTVDLACPERHPKAAAAKDIAAAAVLICAVGAVGVAVCLFIRPAAWGTLFTLWKTEWWRPAAAFGGLIPSAWFIFHK
jgi:diacylglycerol kinase